MTDQQSPVKDWGGCALCTQEVSWVCPAQEFFLVTVLLPFPLKASPLASPFPHFDLAVPFASR